jgi:ferredoxin
MIPRRAGHGAGGVFVAAAGGACYRAAVPGAPAVTPSPRPHTLREHLDRFIADTLARCTRCGRCVEACPMPAYSPTLPSQDPVAVVGGVIALLGQQGGSPAALEWVELCTQSGRCIKACPEGINVMKMVRVARMSALGELGGPAQAAAREEPHFFRRVGAFARMQFDDEEIEREQR